MNAGWNDKGESYTGQVCSLLHWAKRFIEHAVREGRCSKGQEKWDGKDGFTSSYQGADVHIN